MSNEHQCRLVHHAQDKCAFIKANCPDEEAGLLSYLSLYYCALPNAQPVAFTILVLWLGLLFSTIGIAASDFFCINLSTIASILGMSESMAGVTFLAFGNGSPDVFSTFAAMSSNSGSLAIGELIGAAGFITAVVAGSMALVREFKVGKKTFVRDIGFFVVAVSFSTYFLADGELHAWECSLMIGFYVFYVVVVVIWHWYLQQRRRRRERFATARGHFHGAADVEIEVQEEYQDDEDMPAGERRSLISRRSTDDWEALEAGRSPGVDEADSEDEEDGRMGRKVAKEMSNSMRVVRGSGVHRNTPVTPIRPSLVGAMEFRSVLNSLQRSRGSHAKPIHLRRYSEDALASASITRGPPSPASTSEDQHVTVTAPEDGGPISRHASASNRSRAVSMNDVVSNRPTNAAAFTVATIPEVGVVASTPTFPHQFLDIPRTTDSSSVAVVSTTGSRSPTLAISPPASDAGSRAASPVRSQIADGRLAPPTAFATRNRNSSGETRPESKSNIDQSKNLSLTIPNTSHHKPVSQSSSPVTQFPAYTDSPMPMSAMSSRAPSLMLPEAELSSPTSYGAEPADNGVPRPVPWWPYKWLPDPWVMTAILFPTLHTWREKSIIDKFLSIVSAPSIFLLAVTLPVVETEVKDDETDDALDPTMTPIRSSSHPAPRLPADSPSLEPTTEGEWSRYRRATVSQSRGSSISGSHSPKSHGTMGYGGTAGVAVRIEDGHHHQHHSTGARSPSFPFPSEQAKGTHKTQDAVAGPSNLRTNPQQWNRWLVIVQIFTAPLFVMFIVWANSTPPASDPESSEWGFLLRLILYSLLGSLVVLALLLMTTNPDKPPKYRFLFCFAGFVVAISWISTIANEVVGVLKAFGVILGISDAILGLTIFAVGNSLGDLVADITVARLGYPVMALSACFGGPMLNILLGIGVSGLYMTVTQAHHKHDKHPDRKLRYRPFKIEVSGTLMISAITLLITLIGLLIVVPLNKWVMSRKIGYGLITLWAISTIVNLAVEISGAWEPGHSSF